ncbi:hypothetical protein [Trueperella pecoris]|uniref:Uncharacterized protein n=1 Tax=Trueperella pecoris TaxID=2733571 RepID=A0A7M1QYE3_9ACTO|nr:hypothetical protein [Trueperella pecoris]QOR46207.1 hypothetical protein INS88_03085 [Trueperella pecoris]
MSLLQRLFWRSTFNPLLVFVAIVLAFFALRANSTERMILIVLAVALVVVDAWRGVIRRRASRLVPPEAHSASSDDAEPSQE